MIHNHKPLFSKYNAINIKNKNNQSNIALLLNKYGSLSSIGLESDSPFYLSYIQKMLFNFAANHPKINLSNSDHYLLCRTINSLEEIHYINATHINTIVTQTIHPDIKNNVVSYCNANNIDLINLSDKNDLLKKSIKLNKFQKLFGILDSLRSNSNSLNVENQTVNYVALFGKNDALISIGYDGISDVLYQKFNQQQSTLYSFCENDYDYNRPVLKSLTNLIKTGYIESINQPITSLAIQNLVYNVLSDVLGDGYFIQLSSPPNQSDYIGLLSCAIPTKNIQLNLDINNCDHLKHQDRLEHSDKLDKSDLQQNMLNKYHVLSKAMKIFQV